MQVYLPDADKQVKEIRHLQKDLNEHLSYSFYSATFLDYELSDWCWLKYYTISIAKTLGINLPLPDTKEILCASEDDRMEVNVDMGNEYYLSIPEYVSEFGWSYMISCDYTGGDFLKSNNQEMKLIPEEIYDCISTEFMNDGAFEGKLFIFESSYLADFINQYPEQKEIIISFLSRHRGDMFDSYGYGILDEQLAQTSEILLTDKHLYWIEAEDNDENYMCGYSFNMCTFAVLKELKRYTTEYTQHGGAYGNVKQ